MPPRALVLDMPCTGQGHEYVLPGEVAIPPDAPAGLLGRHQPGPHLPWFLKGPGHEEAAVKMTSAHDRAHCPPPDAIRGALAACGR